MGRRGSGGYGNSGFARARVPQPATLNRRTRLKREHELRKGREVSGYLARITGQHVVAPGARRVLEGSTFPFAHSEVIA